MATFRYALHMSPGTQPQHHAARQTTTAAQGAPATARGAKAARATGAGGDTESAGGPADAGEPDADTDSPADARSVPSVVSVAIAALERIVIGSVGITTQALAQAAPDAELTFSQWRALLILGDPPSGHRVGEVAARVGVTLPATSRLLRRLERRGLVALAPDEADRRATRATLTGHGADVRDAIIAFRLAALRDIAEHAGAQGSRVSGAAIDSLAASFERYA
jgi:DNA-binding MarR family transcriptional regulator